MEWPASLHRAALAARFSSPQLVTLFEPENSQIFVDEERGLRLGVSLRDMAQFLESQPFIFAAFAEDEVRNAALPGPP